MNLCFDLSHCGVEIRAGISQGIGRAAKSYWVGAIELNPVLRSRNREAVQSRDGPSRSANGFDCLFMIGSPDHIRQTGGLNFVLHEDPVVWKDGC